MATFRLELNKFLGNFIVGTLRQNPKNGPTSFIKMNTLCKWKPTSTTSLFYDVTQLQYCDTDKTILTCKAIVFGTDVQFITVRLCFVPENAIETPRIIIIRIAITIRPLKCHKFNNKL